VLVSLTGAAAVTTAVLWILEDVIGAFTFWLVSMIIWTAWWVGVIATVLTRVAIFGKQRQRAARPTETTKAGIEEDPITSNETRP
jgi:hypothetical protein